VALAAKFLDELTKVHDQSFHFKRCIINPEDVDDVGKVDSIHLAIDDAIPQRVEVSPMPSWRTHSFEKCIVEIISTLPRPCVKLNHNHQGFPGRICSKDV
jgi:hypothetical protein